MRRNFIYEVQFTTRNLLTGTRYHVSKRVVSNSINEVKRKLRLRGYSIGSDFVYWKHSINQF